MTVETPCAPPALGNPLVMQHYAEARRGARRDGAVPLEPLEMTR